MSQYKLYRIIQDAQPTRCIIAPASIPVDTIHAHLREGEQIAWTGNLADALGLPVSLLDRQKEQVLKAVTDLRGRGQRAHITEQARPQAVQVDIVHETLTALFLGQQTWRDTCWKCSQEVNPFLEHCPHCGADVLPF